jgi:hypothetical protein
MAQETLDALVHQARLDLEQGTDFRAPGGAVTVALCGHWEHEGSCRWPHHTSISDTDSVRVVRTVFVSSPSDVLEVRQRIHEALAFGVGWTLLQGGPAPLNDDERHLARRLADAS